MDDFTPSELGEIAFCVRAQRNKLVREITKPQSDENLRKNRERLGRCLDILRKLGKLKWNDSQDSRLGSNAQDELASSANRRPHLFHQPIPLRRVDS